MRRGSGVVLMMLMTSAMPALGDHSAASPQAVAPDVTGPVGTESELRDLVDPFSADRAALGRRDQLDQ